MQLKNNGRRLTAFVILALIMSLALPSLTLAGGQENATSVDLLRSDLSGVVLEVQTQEVDVQRHVESGEACLTVQMPGTVQQQESGQPQLPVKVVVIGVPPNADLTIQATSLKSSRLAGDATLCPTPQASRNLEVEDLFDGTVGAPDVASEISLAEGVYPEAIATMVDLGFVRSQRLVRLEIWPIQVDLDRHELTHHEQVRVDVHFGGQEATGAISAVPEPATFESALAETLLNYDSARAWRSHPAQALPLSAWEPPNPGYKVLVRGEGMVQLTRDGLAAAGLPVATLDPRTLRMFNSGQEIAIYVTGEADGRLDSGDVVIFYGQTVDTRYTDTNTYWLTYGGAAGLRMVAVNSQAGGTLASAYPKSVHLEENLAYVSSLPMESGFDHWYGQRINVVGAGALGSRSYTVAANQLASGATDARVELLVAGNVNATHHLRLYVNGTQVHNHTWTGRTVYEANVTFPQSYLREGNNTVKVEFINDTPGQTIDIIYMDWLDTTYQRALLASGNHLAFAGAGAGLKRYSVGGFTSNDLELYDVSDPARVQRVLNASIVPQGGGYGLEFALNAGGVRHYEALARAQRLAPVSVSLDTASNLAAPGNRADYIVITHGDFKAAIQPLAARRASQSLQVAVVDVQDVYDEFGYGLMSAEAISDFLAYAYQHWTSPAPSFVLLVGDGTYDMRRYLSNSAPTYLPPYLAMVDPDLGETAADNRFVAVSGADILPDMHVGRLPANTAAEATAMVDKILAYEMSSSPQQAWTQNVLFVADNLEGGGGDFYALSDAAAGYLPETYGASKIYMGRTCPTQNPSTVCRQQIVNTINGDGALMVSYIGHGTKTYWAQERLYDLVALASLDNEGQLPVMLPMTCNEGFFHQAEVGAESLSEAAVRLPAVGAIASWAPTGYGLSTGHDLLERGLFRAMFYLGTDELGAGATAGKLYLVAQAPPGQYRDLIDTFLLLGDPGLLVPLQEPPIRATFLPLLLRR